MDNLLDYQETRSLGRLYLLDDDGYIDIERFFQTVIIQRIHVLVEVTQEGLVLQHKKHLNNRGINFQKELLKVQEETERHNKSLLELGPVVQDLVHRVEHAESDDEVEELHEKLSKTLTQKNSHQRALRKIKKNLLHFEYTETNTGLVSLLAPGLISTCSFLPGPVAWCPYAQGERANTCHELKEDQFREVLTHKCEIEYGIASPDRSIASRVTVLMYITVKF